MKVTPIQDQIIIQELKPTGKSAGGIIVLEKEQTAASKGRVVWVGKGKINQQGERMPSDIKTGDIVYFAKIFGMPMVHNHEHYVAIKEENIIMSVEEENIDA